MSEATSVETMRRIIRQALASMEEHADELGRLDAAAGDGDHGITMVRGMKAAVAVLDANAPDAGALLSRGALAFSDAAGGASGALYGMLFATAGRQLGAGPYATADVAAAMRAGCDVVMRLGKAQPGDKTLLDALEPFLVALDAAADRPLPVAWRTALPAAQAGTAATAGMVASCGRSATLGERSLGHRDPGAVSLTYLLEAVDKVIGEAESDR